MTTAFNHEPVSWRYDHERQELELVQEEAGVTLAMHLTRREVALLDRYIHSEGLQGLAE